MIKEKTVKESAQGDMVISNGIILTALMLISGSLFSIIQSENLLTFSFPVCLQLPYCLVCCLCPILCIHSQPRSSVYGATQEE